MVHASIPDAHILGAHPPQGRGAAWTPHNRRDPEVGRGQGIQCLFPAKAPNINMCYIFIRSCVCPQVRTKCGIISLSVCLFLSQLEGMRKLFK